MGRLSNPTFRSATAPTGHYAYIQDRDHHPTDEGDEHTDAQPPPPRSTTSPPPRSTTSPPPPPPPPPPRSASTSVPIHRTRLDATFRRVEPFTPVGVVTHDGVRLGAGSYSGSYVPDAEGDIHTEPLWAIIPCPLSTRAPRRFDRRGSRRYPTTAGRGGRGGGVGGGIGGGGGGGGAEFQLGSEGGSWEDRLCLPSTLDPSYDAQGYAVDEDPEENAVVGTLVAVVGAGGGAAQVSGKKNTSY